MKFLPVENSGSQSWSKTNKAEKSLESHKNFLEKPEEKIVEEPTDSEGKNALSLQELKNRMSLKGQNSFFFKLNLIK